MVNTNPSLRLQELGAPEIRTLAQVVNALADQRESLQRDVAQKIIEARTSVEEERTRLAALMSELPQSVVVCNLDGRILLYNNRARLQFQVLGPGAPGTRAAPIGLGRLIFAMMERSLITQALESVQHRLQRGSEQPSANFDISTRAGQMLRVHLAPVFSHGGQAQDTAPGASAARVISGYVLMLDNITRQVEAAADPAVWLRHESRPVYYDFDLFRQTEETCALEDRLLTQLIYTVFDTETTGLEPSQGDEIIQIGATRIVNGRLLRNETIDQLIDPRRRLKPESIPIHGITEEMLKGQPTLDLVLPTFHEFCEDTVLVGHNAAFDMRFLQFKEASTGIVFTHPVLDTLLLSAVIHPHQESHRLEAIAERLGVSVSCRHTALGDAMVTGEIFLRMIPLLAEQGIHTLGQARAAAARTYYARTRY